MEMSVVIFVPCRRGLGIRLAVGFVRVLVGLVGGRDEFLYSSRLGYQRVVLVGQKQ